MADMEKIDLFKQLRKEDYAQPKKPLLINVKKGAYLAIEGRGEPGGDDFEAKVGALYAVAYTMKMTCKFGGGQDYVVGKLEGQWWSDEGRDLTKVPKSRWRWKLLIRTPDVVGKGELKQAVKSLKDKGKAPQADEVKLELLAEGPCVQMLHVGPYDKEGETISPMLAFAEAQEYRPHGRHHEIYVSDPRRVPPERLKTILRMPVRLRRTGRAFPPCG